MYVYNSMEEMKKCRFATNESTLVSQTISISKYPLEATSVTNSTGTALHVLRPIDFLKYIETFHKKKTPISKFERKRGRINSQLCNSGYRHRVSGACCWGHNTLCFQILHCLLGFRVVSWLSLIYSTVYTSSLRLMMGIWCMHKSVYVITHTHIYIINI